MKLKPFLGAFTVVASLLASSSEFRAQDSKPLDKKTRDLTLLNGALKDAINAGAKIFNDQGDHAGCYRLYQGALLSVKPHLSPELQKSIDTGFATADKLTTYADRAFELRRVLDEIRAKTMPAGSVTKKGTEPVPLPGKGTETVKNKETVPGKGTETVKNKETVPGKGTEIQADQGSVTGKVTYQGKPIAGGYAVTLIATNGKRVSGIIQKNGTFQCKMPIAPGDYQVIVEPIAGQTATLQLPMRYTSERTSGIMIRVQNGKQQVDLNLVK